MKLIALIVTSLFVFTLASNGALLVINKTTFNTLGAWSVDIDGDMIDDFSVHTDPSRYLFHGDVLEHLADFIKDSSTFATATPVPEELNGVFTAAPTISISTNNVDGSDIAGRALLFHGTSASESTQDVSLIGSYLEAPTLGIPGERSGQIHDNSYYLFYHYFGRVDAGESLTIDYTGKVFAVPEPSSVILLSVGSFLLTLRIRKQPTFKTAPH